MPRKKKKNEILKLKPSMKDKRRYLLIEGSSHEEVSEAVFEYLGVLGHAKAAYFAVRSRPKGFIVGSVLREHVVDVRAALTLKGIQVVKVSNTIAGL